MFRVCYKSSTIRVNGLELGNMCSDMYLGHNISTNEKDSITCDAMCNIWNNINLVWQILGTFLNLLNNNYSSSIALVFMVHLYGSCQVNRCRVCIMLGEKTLKVIWTVPYLTHNHVIVLLTDFIPLEMTFEKWYLTFY